MVYEVRNDNFSKEVLEQKGIVLVDLYATWCGPCKALSPTIEKLADEYDGKVKFAKVDIDKNEEVANQYGVRSIPTLLFFKEGEVVGNLLGLQDKRKIEEILNNM